MILRNVRVHYFRNIVDSGEVNVEGDATCLVGKNESGKTAFLRALNWLNPSRANVQLSSQQEYPAWREKRDRQSKDLESVNLIRGRYELTEREKDDFYERFGEGALTSDEVVVTRNYNGEYNYEISVDESQLVDKVVDNVDVRGQKTEARKCQDIEELEAFVRELHADEENQANESADALRREIEEMLDGANEAREAVERFFNSRLPEFLYFDEYSKLPSQVDIEHVLRTDREHLEDHELTARALLEMAGPKREFLLNQDYERRKRELENVSMRLTQDILDFWSQNEELQVDFDITKTEERRQNQTNKVVIDKLKIRLRDRRHGLTLPFGRRSSGFRWFFSFMAEFSRYADSDSPLVLLLDEPGLGLHANAQKDFLRFINQRLAPEHQVIYTTHSPFMVEPERIERVRLVEEKEIPRAREDVSEEGAKVSEEVLTIDPDTLFPLQGALGYDIAQHLFVAPHTLVVEGTSDFTYLTILSEFLESEGRTNLASEWSIVPVGGADQIPTFVALLGHKIDVTVLIDSEKRGHQKLEELANRGRFSEQRIVGVGEAVNRDTADIEDLFAPEDYLNLFNATMDTELHPSDLEGTDPIVRQVERAVDDESWPHGAPAEYLLRNRSELTDELSEDTLENFENLFKRVNSTLTKN